MQLTIVLGATVTAQLDGHSAVNGALIPEGSTVAATSNDEAVATIAPFVIPAGGAQTVTSAVTVLAVGSTDFHVTVTTPDGSVFEDTATLIVGPVPVPGLTHVTLTLVQS